MLTALALTAAAQCAAITTVNTIDVMPGMAAEARAYYREGWAASREEAVRRDVIDSYALLASQRGESEHPEIILITRYRDAEQFAVAEERFQDIFKSLDLPRPLLIDGKTRAELVGPVVGADDYRVVYSSEGDCGVPGHPD